MLKAVLDTSVLVSAFLKPDGINGRILGQAKDCYQLYLSEGILSETTRVIFTYQRIRKKYLYSDRDAEEFLGSLIAVAHQVLKELPRIKIIEKDPDDDPILACALKTRADYIVSKDAHLKDLEEYQGIKIVSSQEFLEILKM